MLARHKRSALAQAPGLTAFATASLLAEAKGRAYGVDVAGLLPAELLVGAKRLDL